MNPLKKEMQKGINALRLELHPDIVDDIQKRFDAYATDIEKRLLECCQNLGHPAYNHSSSTTISIDNLRDRTFDFLDIPDK